MGLFRRIKNNKKPLIRQIIDLAPLWMIESCAKQHKSDKGCSKYKTYDHFVALTYGQFNKCYTLNDISTGIGVNETFIGDLGLLQSPAQTTMSDGNLLLALINRTIAKKTKSFSSLVEKIRICLTYYLSLNYVFNQVGDGAKKISPEPKLQFNSDLFLG